MRGGKRAGSGRPAGAKNKRTVAVETAARAVAERFKAEVPTAFDGDGVAYLQTVYRDPSARQELRLDAAAKAARFERPQLSAIAVQQQPKAHIDLSRLSMDEIKALVPLLRKAMGMVSTQPAIEAHHD